MQRKDTWLVLEDGSAFKGYAVGAEGETCAELVFNTGITGYQEILTDPSYRGQMVCMTYPHIGNYGVSGEDVESRRTWAEGFVMRELSAVASNYRAQKDLDTYLKESGIVAIAGVDTRAITLRIRRLGAMRAGISTTEKDPASLLKRVRALPDISKRDVVREVTCAEAYVWNQEAGPFTEYLSSAGARKRTKKLKVAVLDFGIKSNMLRSLAGRGCELKVFPAATGAAEIMAEDPDGILLSNGPGDPETADYAVDTIRELLGRKPILGICLGHQLLGLACGAKTVKLKFGHHGNNHPIKNLADETVAITSQNHNFAIAPESVDAEAIEVTHLNLNDQTVAGMRHKKYPAISYQYHPESSPGPHDAQPIFDQFIELMEA